MTTDHSLFYRVRIVPLICSLAFFAILGGCLGSDAGGPALSSAEATAAYVRQAQQAMHGQNADVAGTRAGLWAGVLTLRGERFRVSGVSTADGLVLLRSVDVGADTFTIRELSVQAGRLSGRLLHSRSGGVLEDYGFEGPAESNQLSGALVPPGWTLDEALAGVRLPTALEQERFGRLDLSRVEPGSPLASLQAGRGVTADAALTVAVTPAGAVRADTAGCSFGGGAAPSPSVGGIVEVAGVATGAGCQPGGPITGFLMDSGDGLLTLTVTDGLRSGSKTFQWPAP